MALWFVLLCTTLSGAKASSFAAQIAEMTITFSQYESRYSFKGIYALHSQPGIIEDAPLHVLNTSSLCSDTSAVSILPVPRPQREGWVGLVKDEKNCSFTAMSIAAARQGAVGVIVASPQPNKIILIRGHKEQASTIPIVSIGGQIFLELAHLLEVVHEGRVPHLKLVPGAQLGFIETDPVQTLIDSLVVFVGLFSAASLAAFVVQLGRWRHLIWAAWLKQRRDKRYRRLAEKGLKTWPVQYYEVSENSYCAICLEQFQPGDCQRTLPCPHSSQYHMVCVDQWLVLHRTCPICKRDFTDGFILTAGGVGGANLLDCLHQLA